MKRATHDLTGQPGRNPGPNVQEPCAWCGELAVLVAHGSTAVLDCPGCGVRVEVDAWPAQRRRPPRVGLRAAA